MNNKNAFTLKGFIVWIVCATFYLYEFFLRTVIGAFQKPVMHDLHLSSVEFSLLSSTIFLFIYGFMQIPVGLIVGQIGLKKSLFIGVILCAMASIGFSYAESYSIAILYRLLMGIGSSFGFICLLVSAQEWMPHKYSALFIGLSGFIGTLGAMLAAGPLESVSENSSIDWRFVFLCLGGVGFALSIFIWMFVENNHQETEKYVILSRPESMAKKLISLLSKSQPFYIAIFSACIFFTIEYLSENEGRLFLLLKNCSHKFASYTITISWLGYAIGGPILGILSDFFQRRKIFIIIASLCGILSAIIVALSTNHYCIMGAFFLLGVSASGQGIAFALIAEQFKKGYVALAFGLNNAMISTASAIIAPVMGWMLDYSKADCNATLHDYYFSFSVIIILLVISLLISSFFILETYCKSSAEFTYLKPPACSKLKCNTI
jgi:MFS family permease